MDANTIRHQLEVEYEEAINSGELAGGVNQSKEYTYRLQQLQIHAMLLQTEAIEKLVIQVNMVATTLAQMAEEK